jgi:hypothetical protein
MKKLLASLMVAVAPGYLVLTGLVMPKVLMFLFAAIGAAAFGGGIGGQIGYGLARAFPVINMLVYGPGLSVLPLTGTGTIDVLITFL